MELDEFDVSYRASNGVITLPRENYFDLADEIVQSDRLWVTRLVREDLWSDMTATAAWDDVSIQPTEEDFFGLQETPALVEAVGGPPAAESHAAGASDAADAALPPPPQRQPPQDAAVRTQRDAAPRGHPPLGPPTARGPGGAAGREARADGAASGAAAVQSRAAAACDAADAADTAGAAGAASRAPPQQRQPPQHAAPRRSLQMPGATLREVQAVCRHSEKLRFEAMSGSIVVLEDFSSDFEIMTRATKEFYTEDKLNLVSASRAGCEVLVWCIQHAFEQALAGFQAFAAKNAVIWAADQQRSRLLQQMLEIIGKSLDTSGQGKMLMTQFLARLSNLAGSQRQHTGEDRYTQEVRKVVKAVHESRFRKWPSRPGSQVVVKLVEVSEAEDVPAVRQRLQLSDQRGLRLEEEEEVAHAADAGQLPNAFKLAVSTTGRECAVLTARDIARLEEAPVKEAIS